MKSKQPLRDISGHHYFKIPMSQSTDRDTVASDHGFAPQVILMHLCHMSITLPGWNGQYQHSKIDTDELK